MNVNDYELELQRVLDRRSELGTNGKPYLEVRDELMSLGKQRAKLQDKIFRLRSKQRASTGRLRWRS